MQKTAAKKSGMHLHTVFEHTLQRSFAWNSRNACSEIKAEFKFKK